MQGCLKGGKHFKVVRTDKETQLTRGKFRVGGVVETIYGQTRSVSLRR